MDTVQASRSSHWRNIALYLAVCLPICLLGTWNIDVISMEGIIADGARHMLDTHEWFVPKLYGKIYAFKPSLAYWMVAASEGLLGVRNELTLRLPSILCAIGMGLVIYAGVARLAGSRAGLYAALALATCGIFVEQARMAGFDMPLALGVTLAMLAALQCLLRGRPDWRWWMLGYTGLTFGFLAKGLPAAAMYFPGLLAACIVTRQLRQLFRWQHLLGLALFMALTAAYLLLAYRQEGPAAFADQLAEIGYRSSRWDGRAVFDSLTKPFVIFGIGLPWSILLPVLVFHPRLRLWDEQARGLARAAGAFLVAGTLVWMTATTHNPRYYLPLMAPMAVLAGLTAEALERDRRTGQGAAEGRARARWSRVSVPILLTVVGLIYCGGYIAFHEPQRAAARSMRGMAAAFDPHLPADAKVFIDTSDGCSSLFYYLNHDVGRWSILGPPPKSAAYVVLMGDQVDCVLSRDDLHTELLARFSGPEGRSYALARVSGRQGSGT
jgi:4-amino-4-deoxy-L-arabinose transferase-like glycosyltransferase